MHPYIPKNLPPAMLDYKKLLGLVGEANASLARYDGLLQAVINPEILLSPLTTREAVLSSKIEGTQATVDEVLQHEAGMPAREDYIKQDIQEIQNYRSTLIQAEKELKTRPLNLFLIRQMHKELMSSVRGSKKEPGKFRQIQNWIGQPGKPIKEASYIPPEPHLLMSCLTDLEIYMQKDDGDVLVQSSIIHAQFELIHPFLDGNGRIGRLLIPLFLYQRRRLSWPMFYLSEYMEEHREEYYSRLNSISASGSWNDWIEFYLQAIVEQGLRNTHRVQKILDLYQEIRSRISSLTRSRFSPEITDALFNKPIFRASDIQIRTKIAKQTLMPILKQLSEANILNVIKPVRGRSPAVMKFSELLTIVEN